MCTIAGLSSRSSATSLRIEAHRVTRHLVQGDAAHVIAGDSRGELRIDIGERHDRMTPGLRGKPVDQVDNAVLQAADRQAIDDVDDQWRHRAYPRLARAAASARSIDGDMSRANARTADPVSSSRERLGV